MKRYFYPASRAHHAYCMAIDHGMEFERRFGKWEPEGLIHLAGATGYKIAIHPDSLHLLEPQDGDVGIWDQEWSGHRDEGRFSYPVIGRYASNEPYTSVDYRPPMHTIIQRNGKPFHWPECEPV